MNNIVVRKVKKVFLHLHLDEIFALFLAIFYGKKHFEGLEEAIGFKREAGMSFTDKNDGLSFTSLRSMSIQTLIEKGWLGIGCAGDISDEHRNGSMARIPNSSASKLMAIHLGVNAGIFEVMTQEVTRWDENKKCPMTHLGSILKMIRGNYGGMEKRTVIRCFKIFLTVLSCLDRKLPKRDGEPSFLSFTKEILDQANFANEKAKMSVLRFLEEEDESTDPQIFGLKNVFQSLWRATTCDDDKARKDYVKDVIEFFIGALYKDQYNFTTLQSLLIKEKNSLLKWCEVDLGPAKVIRVGFTETDKSNGHSVLRSISRMAPRELGYHITVVRNGKGNYSIMGNQDALKEMGLMDKTMKAFVNLVAMLRYRDMDERLRQQFDWEKLTEMGEIPESKWYLSRLDWLQILNGSHNHDVPASTIPPGHIMEMIKVAFDEDQVDLWRKRMGVRSNSKALRAEVLNGKKLADVFDSGAGISKS